MTRHFKRKNTTREPTIDEWWEEVLMEAQQLGLEDTVYLCDWKDYFYRGESPFGTASAIKMEHY